MSELEEQLGKILSNPGQRDAYFAEGSCVVQACPGSGKTATLAVKVMKLLEEIPEPRGLACITFNNEAVREFKNRLRSMGLRYRQNLVLSTVHSFCLGSIIKPFARIYYEGFPDPYSVASNAETEAALARAMDTVGVNLPPREYVFTMSDYRRSHVDRDSPEWQSNPEIAAVILEYERLLRNQNLIDFDDQILIALKIIEGSRYVRDCLHAKFPWIVIDEYQDLGYPLHRIVQALAADGKIKIFAVGDPDQSIYSFLGANPTYLQELGQHPNFTPIPLGLNYRCGQRIIDGAEIVLDANNLRGSSSGRPNDERGEIDFIERTQGFDSQLDAITTEIIPQLIQVGVEPKNIGILYIDHTDGARIAEKLEENGIEYRGEKDRRYDRSPLTRWLEELASWCSGNRGSTGIKFSDLAKYWEGVVSGANVVLRIGEELQVRTSLYRVASELADSEMSFPVWLEAVIDRLEIGKLLDTTTDGSHDKTALETLVSASEGTLSNYTVADFAGCGDRANRITLTTLHSSKGLQFDAVIIPGMEQGRLPNYRAQNGDRLREARRTFYVGLTRARVKVFLLYSGWYRFGRHTFRNGPSIFLNELRLNT